MTVGIDISQLAYPNVGVSNYLTSLIENMVLDNRHTFILLFSSRRGKVPLRITKLLDRENVKLKRIKLTPSVLDMLWNRLHKIPVEKFIGSVDYFITSDWTEPPVENAQKATILYDLVVYKYPHGTDQKIIKVHKRKLRWVKKESDIIFCISESTKKDAQDILGIASEKLKVVYPGFSL